MYGKNAVYPCLAIAYAIAFFYWRFFIVYIAELILIFIKITQRHYNYFKRIFFRMSRVLAFENFTCINNLGKKFNAHVVLDMPKLIKNSEAQSVHFECLISIEPLIKKHIIYGENSFQALCMSLESIRGILKSFVADGGRVYWRDTNHPVDLDSPWFAPMYSFN